MRRSAGTLRLAGGTAAAILATVVAAGGKESAMGLHIGSPAFTDRGSIPVEFTCQGANVSPPLTIGGVPSAAGSLVLIVDDPDAPDPAAPKTTWVHWVLYNIPPTTATIPQAAAGGALPPGSRQGLNDWQRADYGGPCPPIGSHRYYFKLYAVDRRLDFPAAPTKAQLEQAMQGRIVASAELIGLYRKR